MNNFKTVDLENLRHNLKTIKSKLNEKTKFCAVVKDNAYGHGMADVVPTMNNYVDYYAVANMEEAKELRSLTHLPILCLGEFNCEDLNDALKYDIELTISSIKNLQLLANSLKGKEAKIHLAVNSGMHRLGFYSITEFKKALSLLKSYPKLQIKGIYSHIGDYENFERANKQNECFKKFCKHIPKNLSPILHIANSGTMFTHNEMQYDMVRVGINLYGYGNNQLKPIMEVFAKIMHIQKVSTEDLVGYGSTHKLNKNTTLAVIGIGYGQGFLRSNEKFGFVIINGKLCKIVANICMDMTIVDVSKVKCKVGDVAIIMGHSTMHTINAEQLALFNNTISYEILTNFNKIKNSILLHD